METYKARWKISLNNGQTFYEGKGNFKTIAGELSPYQKLLKYIQENNLTITSMALYTDDNRVHNSPSKGKNPHFKAFHESTKPIKYIFERKIGYNMGGDVDKFTVISAVYEDNKKMSIWVDESNSNNVYTLLGESDVY